MLVEYEAQHYDYKLKTSTSGQQFLKLSRVEQAEFAIALLHEFRQFWQQPQQTSRKGLSLFRVKPLRGNLIIDLIPDLVNRKLPFTEPQVLEWLMTFCNEQRVQWRWGAPVTKLVRYYLSDHEPTSELLDQVEQMCRILERFGGPDRKYAAQLRQLTATQQKTLSIRPGEAWSDRALQQLDSLPENERSPWIDLITGCSIVSGSKPAATWLKKQLSYRDTIGLDRFNAYLLEWFALADQPRTQPLRDWRGGEDFFHDQNADILKGLVWLCADQTDAELARGLSQLTVSAYRKLPGIGPRCVKLGNACVWALGQMPMEEAIAQLALLKVKVKFGTAQKGIEKALTAAAEREGISREEIEELSVPTYGLTEVGIRRETLGDFTAELIVTGTTSTELRWLKPDGKPQKSVPKAVKENQANALKGLKQAANDIKKMLPAQRDRIESLYLQQKTWDVETWRSRYLNHPLVGTLARRILWQFESHDDAEKRHSVGIWWQGQLVNVEGTPIDWLSERDQVSLWHPITATVNTIQAWRTWLQEHEVQQPFKQAHRELYLLTAAEEQTHVYSNRFAAHILKQHQFNALCGQRGWKNQLRLMVDDSYNPANLPLPQWGLRAEFWIEAIGDDYGTDTTDTGTYLYIATDQVRFYPVDAADHYAHAGGGGYTTYGTTAATPLPLNEIPALVFTEVMRDVDLFVGVASVGNDPNWADGGPEGRHYDYWQRYCFGDLSATAQTRRQVLENLIPRLKKIRDRCSLRDRFLIVRGDIRTYKIHLGSGNILMEPNDQYLCIVSAKSTDANKVFLPFEGDKTLSMILSKAFLLAADSRITDPTIVSQIQR
ncbi:MAG: DUF4132 domain-containing protein [Cyanothece sp. SIO2G6]|nr:DUF4132 domain-containing protein [Cyanothece sp. SIO2G6]